MILDWFDAREAVAFGELLVQEIGILFPLGADAARKSPSAKKERKRLEGLVTRTRSFAQGHKLNIYTKAKLLNTVKWKLREQAYPDEMVDEIIALLAPVLNG
jgi:hypothetical protein